MQKNHIVIFLSIFSLVFLIGIYFWVMKTNGFTSLSNSNADWGAFGAYIGGIVTSITAAVTAFLLYKNLQAYVLVSQLEITRKSLEKLDNSLRKNLNDKKITNPFDELGSKISQIQFLELTYPKEVTLKDIYSSSDAYNHNLQALLSCANIVAALCQSVEFYFKVNKKQSINSNDIESMELVEQFYWISEYSPIITKIKFICGKDNLIEKLGDRGVQSINTILCNNIHLPSENEK